MLFFPDGLVGSIRTFVQRKLRPTVAPLVSIATLVRGRTKAPRGNGADAAPAAAAPSVLRVQGATKSFGAVRALEDMSIDVVAGEIHGLVGPNGSGKTTLLNALSAFIRLDSGSVTVEGTSKRSARARARQGVGRTFQTPRVFEGLTMWENIDVARDSPGADSALDRAALAEVRERWDAVDAAALPHAQRRLPEIVRVLQTDPRILRLDEPAAGLSAEERLAFADVLRILAHELGIAVVLVEHDLTLVWHIADRITVMDEGRMLCSGTPEELNENPALEAVLLTGGRRVDAE
jgi:branched-chain amino acid transport system permease protein